MVKVKQFLNAWNEVVSMSLVKAVRNAPQAVDPANHRSRRAFADQSRLVSPSLTMRFWPLEGPKRGFANPPVSSSEYDLRY